MDEAGDDEAAETRTLTDRTYVIRTAAMPMVAAAKQMTICPRLYSPV